MKAYIIVFLALLAHALGDEYVHPAMPQIRWYQEFEKSLSPLQKKRYEALKKEVEKDTLKRLRDEARGLSIQYEGITGKKVTLAENDRETLQSQVDAMKRVIAEHDKKQRPDADRQGLDEAAVFKAERDARNAEWQAQRQKQRMNQLESDLREAEGKLRRMQGR